MSGVTPLANGEIGGRSGSVPCLRRKHFVECLLVCWRYWTIIMLWYGRETNKELAHILKTYYLASQTFIRTSESYNDYSTSPDWGVAGYKPVEPRRESSQRRVERRDHRLYDPTRTYRALADQYRSRHQNYQCLFSQRESSRVSE